MPDRSEQTSIVKRELGNRGYVVELSTHREGEYVVGRVQVTSAETGDTVAKVVGVGQLDQLSVCFGVDAEGTIRDVIFRALSAWQDMRNLVPSLVVKPPTP